MRKGRFTQGQEAWVPEARGQLGDALRVDVEVRRHGRVGACRLKAPEDENGRLKRMPAETMLDTMRR